MNKYYDSVVSDLINKDRIIDMTLIERDRIAKIFLVVFVVLYFVFQLIYINADTPISFSGDAGLYCDEGYKTLDARNLVLFGKAHWTEMDEYSGWIKGSPITVYFNFLLFKLFGVSLGVARLGNLLFALGSLLLFYLILKKIYDQQSAFWGVILCAVNQIYFFYSRVALLEFKMMFFILFGIYFMLFVKQNYLFIAPTIICWIAAYYCKFSVTIFYISVFFYFIIIYKNGLLLNKILRPRNLIFIALIFLAVFAFLEYIFLYHRDYYDNMCFFKRHFRSPPGAVFHWITQKFFTKNPFLSFLAVIYTGYISILIVEGSRPYSKRDLFFVIWLVLGTAMLSFISYQPLRYYVYLVFPLIILAIRSILSFSSIWNTLFEKRRLWLRGSIFVFSFYLLVIHSGFLPFMPVRTGKGWDLQAVKMFGVFSVMTVLILTVIYIVLLKKKDIAEIFSKGAYRNFAGIVIILILGIQLLPIAKWSLNPKYELAYISNKISELKDDSIIVGDWAPQLAINTDRKALYLIISSRGIKRGHNFYNLDKIKPHYLVIVDGLNDYILRQFNLTYPRIAKNPPHYNFTYGGRTILFYELNF